MGALEQHLSQSGGIRQGRVVRYVAFATLVGGGVHTLACWVALQLSFFRDYDAFEPFFTLAWIGHGLFLALVLSGVNRRCRDPYLTQPLLWWSTLVLVVSVYQIDQVRLPVMMLFFAILQLGLFRSTRRQYARLSVACVAGYLAGILLAWQWHPERVELAVELIQWFGFALMTAAIVFMAGEIGLLSQRLADRNQELADVVRWTRALAVQDELTGLFNRRYATERLAKLRELADRGGLSLTVAYADLDHFKHINDRSGHQEGDRVLREFAALGSALLDERDFMARFGGEEFLLVFVEHPEHEVWARLERLRSGLAQQVAADGVPVTVSLGMACFQPGDSLDGLLQRADAALYRAKQAGRNRVERAAPVPEEAL